MYLCVTHGVTNVLSANLHVILQEYDFSHVRSLAAVQKDALTRLFYYIYAGGGTFLRIILQTFANLPDFFCVLYCRNQEYQKISCSYKNIYEVRFFCVLYCKDSPRATQ